METKNIDVQPWTLHCTSWWIIFKNQFRRDNCIVSRIHTHTHTHILHTYIYICIHIRLLGQFSERSHCLLYAQCQCYNIKQKWTTWLCFPFLKKMWMYFSTDLFCSHIAIKVVPSSRLADCWHTINLTNLWMPKHGAKWKQLGKCLREIIGLYPDVHV